MAPEQLVVTTLVAQATANHRCFAAAEPAHPDDGQATRKALA